MKIKFTNFKLNLCFTFFIMALLTVINYDNAFASTPVPKQDYSNNLVAKYLFNETSGTTCIDSKGTYNGTYTGTTSVTDTDGTYRTFNNITGSASTANYITFSNSVVPVGKKSIKFKVKLLDSQIMHILNTTNASGATGEYGLAFTSTNYCISVQIDNNGSKEAVGSSVSLNDNKFHTILYTYDGNITHKLYVDDMINPIAVYTSSFIESRSPNRNLYIGGRDLLTYGFKGSLDDLEIYNDVLEYHIPTTSLTIDPSTKDILQGETATLTPILTPSDATNQSVNWTSSDTTIATVDQITGKITGLAPGTVTITATTTDGTNLSASCTVNVLPQSTNMAKLTITMTSGIDKQYDLSMTEIDSFINWYDNKAAGTGASYYTFTKTLNIAPFIKIRQYVIFDKIVSFDVSEYNAQ